MNAPSALPLRSDGTRRPAGLPLPPARMPLLRGGRPLKRWRYVGVYGPQIMLCAASVRIAGDPPGVLGGARPRDRARWPTARAFTPGLVAIADGHLSVRGARRRDRPGAAAGGRADGGDEPARRLVHLDAQGPDPRRRARDGDGPHARDRPCGPRSTRRRATTRARPRGAGRPAWAPRRTGAPLAWNLVTGVHDAPVQQRADRLGRRRRRTSPRPSRSPATWTAWTSPRTTATARLRFTAEAERARRDDLKLFVSDYRQPFGTFSGTLPGGVELAEGYGVMEWHDVRW